MAAVKGQPHPHKADCMCPVHGGRVTGGGAAGGQQFNNPIDEVLETVFPGQPADVPEPVVTEARGAHKPSKLEQMMAAGPRRIHVEQDVTNHEQLKGDVKAGDRVTTSSDTIDMYWLYKDGMARKVPTGNLQVCIDNGLSIVCDICGGEHQDELNPNACPSRARVKGWQCPVCGKVIWGVAEGKPAGEASTDPNVIIPKPVGDPVVLAEMRGHEHMSAFHPSMAKVYGVQVDRVLADLNRIPAAVGA